MKEIIMRKNKILMTGVLVMLLVFVMVVFGCKSYSHTQAVRNETGVTVREVFIRDTGTNEWGNAKNVRARTDSDGYIIYRQNEYGRNVVAYWDRYDINNATEIVFFSDPSFSETPKGIKNQDIAIRDSNGLLYMKHNVPITYTTSQVSLFGLGQSTVLTRSSPIIFTVEDRLPMLFVVNQTGHSVNLISPTQTSIANNARTQFQPMEMNRPIDVVYSIGQATYTEQVTMNNADATVTLTRKPPTITIANNVGATINMIFLRQPNSPEWIGGNIVTRDGTVHLARQAQTGDISGSIVNRDSMRIWMGNIPISGDRFDIRIDDVQGNSYVKSNVEVTRDLTLNFTQSDKR